MFKAVVNSARGERSLNSLTEKGYITSEEKDYFDSLGPRGLLNASGYLNTLVQHAMAVGLFGNYGDSFLVCVTQDLTFIRGNGADVGMYLDCQLPYAFIQLVAISVYCFFIQLIYVSSSFISNGMAENSNSKVLTGYITLILYCFVMTGLLDLFVTLENPLGGYARDLPVDTYLQNLAVGYEDIIQTSLQMLEMNINSNSVSFIKGYDFLPTTRSGSPRSDTSGVDLFSKLSVAGSTDCLTAHDSEFKEELVRALGLSLDSPDDDSN